MAECVLKALNIKKTFVTGEVETPVLKGVDFTLDEGEFVAIVGESGSGKSTLLYILAGIDKPSEGRVELLGQDLCNAPDEEIARMRRRDFSFVYQFDNLVPNLTVYENVTLPLMLDKKRRANTRLVWTKFCNISASKTQGRLSSSAFGRRATARCHCKSPCDKSEIIFLTSRRAVLTRSAVVRLWNF